jgi:hypothetical protein
VVRLVWPGGTSGPVAVGADGALRLARPVVARTFRLEILDAAAPAGAAAGEREAVGIAEIRGIGGLAPILARTFSTGCEAIQMSVDGHPVALRVTGSAAAFERGDPLPAVACGPPVRLAAGPHLLVTASGPFSVDALRLASPPPNPPVPAVAAPAAASGRVLDSGRLGRSSVDRVRVSVGAPSWLVLGQGYDRGWRAWCNGRSLGAPVPIDGYANAWPIEPGCRDVRFAFAPQTLAAAGYVASGVGGLLCLAALVLMPLARRGRGRTVASRDPASDAFWPPREPPVRWPARRVVLPALLGGCVLGFVFGVGAGVVCVPAIAFVLWRGVAARALTYGAGLLLGIVVPVLYLANAPSAAGGNHYAYPAQHMSAHWVGVAAVVLLLIALWRTLSGRRRSPDRVPPSAREDEPVAVR